MSPAYRTAAHPCAGGQLNHAAKMTYSDIGGAVRVGHLEADTSVTFDGGAVDFSPQRTLVPGAAPNFFPPKTAPPGSVGDAAYSPLVRLENAGNHIYNAPVVAFDVKESQIRFCKGGVRSQPGPRPRHPDSAAA